MEKLRHVLHGMSDLDTPLGLETYERTVRHETNTPADAPLPGFAKTVHAFRPTFVGSGYVKDEGDIPTGKNRADEAMQYSSPGRLPKTRRGSVPTAQVSSANTFQHRLPRKVSDRYVLRDTCQGARRQA